MKWIKRGIIFSNKNQPKWAKNSALTPTPLLMGDIIRIFCGFRDEMGVSRIGFVDVSADNPQEIVKISNQPIIDLGVPGTFDDNGLIMGDVVKDDKNIRLYYVGFQLVQKVKFFAFTGLAISKDDGNSFEKISNVPVLDRTKDEIYIRAIHTILFDEGCWKIWYAAGNKWEIINSVPYPCYNIHYMESKDGIDFSSKINHKICIDVVGSEYRIGRPRVYKLPSNIYLMFYTKGTIDGSYFPGYAISYDGISWERKDEDIGISLSESGWDSDTLCYPSLIFYKDKTYMFYNGNKMGYDGFGYAELDGSLI
ncbi:MAG: hypothetical protein J0I09_05255 [Sphingobacteriia bacterium]|nr:hypothetical protein [Sphingobacteriia bacterium]